MIPFHIHRNILLPRLLYCKRSLKWKTIKSFFVSFQKCHLTSCVWPLREKEAKILRDGRRNSENWFFHDLRFYFFFFLFYFATFELLKHDILYSRAKKRDSCSNRNKEKKAKFSLWKFITSWRAMWVSEVNIKSHLFFPPVGIFFFTSFSLFSFSSFSSSSFPIIECDKKE